MWFWRKKSLLKNYISELDQFLQAFDKRPEATSASRKAEETKYQRINQLRDSSKANTKECSVQIWENSESSS
jgi:hypothetical protein